MKTPLLLPEKSDVHGCIEGLWKTDIFRQSHRAGGFVHNIVDRFARLPRFFAEMSDDYLERAHFNIWWSGLHPRAYESAANHDLYLLHEIAHGGDMVHIAGQHAENFHRKMIDNELYASAISEIVAYFALPDLRAMTFTEEIFADRFLRDPAFQAKWKEDPERFGLEICYRRRQAMFYPERGDKAAEWLHRFTSQNDRWFMIWKHKFDLVETAMETLTRTALLGDRKGALERHIDWLCSKEISRGGDIPFPDEAAAFAEIYWKNRETSPAQRAA